ncbi:MAG: hypothetical protein M9909_05150 [Thermomicrobiales bacterium]|nr:hypothetical protein [Thermomicrobiales bacterium]
MTPAAVVRVLRRLTVMEITSSFMYRTQFDLHDQHGGHVLIGLMIGLRLDQSGVDLPVNREFIVSYYPMLAIVACSQLLGIASIWPWRYAMAG